jgi:hypothetical protein
MNPGPFIAVYLLCLQPLLFAALGWWLRGRHEHGGIFTRLLSKGKSNGPRILRIG